MKCPKLLWFLTYFERGLNTGGVHVPLNLNLTSSNWRSFQVQHFRWHCKKKNKGKFRKNINEFDFQLDALNAA